MAEMEIRKKMSGDRISRIPVAEESASIETGSNETDKIMWGNSPDLRAEDFLGREEELATLFSWIINFECRIVSIIGIGGIGKSTLTARLCKGLLPDDTNDTDDKCLRSCFEYIYWIDLMNGPTLSKVLVDIIRLVSDRTNSSDTSDTVQLTTKLINYLKEKRTLIVFDNVESILKKGERNTEKYKEGYDDYDQLFSAIGRTEHKGCLLINSRENPPAIVSLEETEGKIRTYKLKGLDFASCKKYLNKFGFLVGNDNEWKELIRIYDGNPSALRLVSKNIIRVFQSKISDFLRQDDRLFGHLANIMEWHYNRLTDAQRQVFIWISLYREPVSLQELQESIIDYDTKKRLPSILEELQDLTLIKSITDPIYNIRKFYMQPVFIEHLYGKIIEDICDDILNVSFNILPYYSILRNDIEDNVRKIQIQNLIEPIIKRLDCALPRKHHEIISNYLHGLRAFTGTANNYAAGNIINILSVWDNGVIEDYDFSNLFLREANMQYVKMYDVDFSNCTLNNVSFKHQFGPFSSVAISSDGELIAANQPDGVIHVWRTCDGQLIHNLDDGHISWVFGLEFSPNGRYLASGGEDKSIYLWNLTTLNKHLIGKHDNSVWTIAFSKDGNMLATGSEDRYINIYDIQDITDAKLKKRFQAHEKKVYSVKFIQFGEKSILVSAGADKKIKYWDVNNDFNCINEKDAHDDCVRCIDYCEYTEKIVSCSWDHSVRVWDVSSIEKVSERQFKSEGLLHCVSCHPEKPIVAIGGENGFITIWNYLENNLEKVINFHDGEVWKIQFSNDGKRLVSGGYDGNIIVWNTIDWKPLLRLYGYVEWVQDIAVSNDNKYLVSTNGDLKIRVWDIEHNKRISRFPAHTGWAFSVDYAPDDKVAASGSDDLSIKIWNAFKWDKVPPVILNGHRKWVQAVAFNNKGDILASADDDAVINLWERKKDFLNYGKLVGHKEGIWSLAFSNDDAMLASAGEDCDIIIWDYRKKKLLHTLRGHIDRIHKVLFSKDDKYLYSCGEDNTILRWDIATQTSELLVTNSSWIMDMALSDDGDILYAGDKMGFLIKYSLTKKKIEKKIKAHYKGIWSLVYASNTKRVYSASEDGLIKEWHYSIEEQPIRIFREKKPYEGLILDNIDGITEAQIAILIMLGAKQK